MTKDALEIKKQYMKNWREQNKEKIKEYQRNWRKNNTEKVKKYNADYWERKTNEEVLANEE